MTSLDGWIGHDIPDVVMEDAASWMALLDSERCNEADHLAFARWLEQDQNHRAAFEVLSEVWARLRMLSDVEPLLEHPKVVRFPGTTASVLAKGSNPLPEPRRDWSALAAIVLVTLGAATHVALSTPAETFVTTVAESRDVVLSDASVMEMNTKTRVEVVIDDKQRVVNLVSGEVVFHVQKDSRPFIVKTEYGTVSALGTTFAVETGDGSLQVSVIEGSVSVTGGHAEFPLTEFDGSEAVSFKRSDALLEAGESLELSGDKFEQRQLSADEFSRQHSWRDGVVEFDAQPLRTVVEEMQRYTTTSIHIVDEQLAKLRISGRFETDDINHFVSQLHDKYEIYDDGDGQGWIVLRAGPP